jgi:hypothetical protein
MFMLCVVIVICINVLYCNSCMEEKKFERHCSRLELAHINPKEVDIICEDLHQLTFIKGWD